MTLENGGTQNAYQELRRRLFLKPVGGQAAAHIPILHSGRVLVTHSTCNGETEPHLWAAPSNMAATSCRGLFTSKLLKTR